MSKFHTVVIVDNTDPDNLACALAAARPESLQKLLAVIVTGRAANFNREAAIDDMNSEDSQFTLRLNATRMKNFLTFAGFPNIPVFVGSVPPSTIVPHRVHIDEKVFCDTIEEQRTLIHQQTGNIHKLAISGNIDTAGGYLTALNQQFDVIVGGPMTDLAELVSHYPHLRVNSIHAQFGMFGFGEKKLMEFGETPRGKRQFNVACDPVAAKFILEYMPCPIYLYPSDVTRVDSIGFENPEHLRRHLHDTHTARELVRIYQIAYDLMMKPRNEKIYIHDLAPLLGYLDLSLYAQNEVEDRGARIGKPAYLFKPAEINHVPFTKEEKSRWGEIDVVLGTTKQDRPRYIATEVDTDWYLKETKRLLC